MQPDRTAELTRLLRARILILDGAMGTMIQQCRLREADFRGPLLRPRTTMRATQGDNDLLVLTRPDAVRSIHDAYFEAGADIVETNTFSATRIAQADYRHAGPGARESTSAAAAHRARRGRPLDGAHARRPRFVAGALGPTNRTASISPDVNDPGARNVTFDELALAYARGRSTVSIEGGATCCSSRRCSIR